MADSIREKIGQELELKLQSILVENGYNFDSGSNVNRAKRSYNDCDLPAITIWLGVETSTREYNAIKRVMVVDIDSLGLSNNLDTITDDTEINSMIADIQTCIETNTADLSDLIEGVQETNIEPIYPDEGSRVVSARVTFEITYKTAKSDPYINP